MSAHKPMPLPWRLEEVADTGGEDCIPICEILSGDGTTRAALVAEHVHGPDAELIVRAVNCHADLLAALRWMVENDDTERGGEWETINAYWIAGLERARAAIAKAEGRT